jgi:UDP-N-acetylglucosamine 2-epimerase (non-hydrolysing)
LDFIALQSQAFTILTDSGGIQEEACALKIPCVTIRENTERPETVEVGANVLVGRNVTKAIAAIEGFKKKSKNWQNPFGDGQTAVRVCDILFDEISEIRLPEELEKLKLSVVGLGYMGLPMAALLARRGFEVAGIDISESKISALKAGQCPLEEPGLPSLLKQASSKRFSFHRKPQKADVFVVAVPTPEHDKKCDLKYVVAAVESLVPFLEDGNLLIVESTIRPRTMVDVIRPIVDKSGKRVLLAHCPERAIPGKSIYELTHNDRVIGGVTLEASALAHSIYSQFIQGEIFVTDSVTAECVKLMENTYRDVNIAIANEFDQIGHELGISAREAIRLANRHPRVNILEPGIGVGGHCIAIDPWFLVESVEHAPLIKTAREVNDKRPHWVADKILAKFPKAKKIGILGVTYKPDVDDIRETPVEHIVEHLISKGADVKYFDPYYAGDFVAKFANLEELQIWADELILLVNHSKFNSLKFNKPVRRFWEL